MESKPNVEEPSMVHIKVHNVLNKNALDIAYKCLQSGDVIALPTDTVYGFACDANNKEAIKTLYKIKGRDFHKPVAICVSNLNALRRYGNADHLNDTLFEHLLPGPITIVIERSKHLSNPFLNPTTNKIGIRIPEYKFLQELCARFSEQPLALTSANRSAMPSSLNIREFQELWPELGAIFEAGQIGLTDEQRLASTVIDLSSPNGQYKVVREGIALKETCNILHRFGLKSFDSLCSGNSF